TNQDIIEASAVSMENKYLGVIIAFNSEILGSARNLAEGKNIKMFQGNVIYRIIEDYELWVEKEKERDRIERGKTQVMPAKLKILPGCVFRESKPAIVGVEVIAGTVSPGFNILRRDG
ncbi:MAG: intein-containing translation initiation factor IF-2, partial [Candidatus Altiarchaeales archaeon]|nr:intein-containing translation initiation factor IF-2 [Candidatus Altiarchaeales archaeon]